MYRAVGKDRATPSIQNQHGSDPKASQSQCRNQNGMTELSEVNEDPMRLELRCINASYA